MDKENQIDMTQRAVRAMSGSSTQFVPASRAEGRTDRQLSGIDVEPVRERELPRRCYVGKVGISVTTMAQSLQLLDERVQERLPAYVCVANVQATVLSQRDPDFCRIQNDSFLTIPDGMPLIWYARMSGEQTIARVTGPDLMIEILTMSSRCGYSHYFYGDTQETLWEMKRVIADRFPGAAIVGMESPPFRSLSDKELDETVRNINRLRPSFVWVALGCPKQERWIARVFPHIQSGILVGVGAAFRFLIGEYRHPSRALQRCGLEGIFWRGLKRPVYVAKWYAYHIPAFGFLLAKELAKRLVAPGHGSV